MFFESKIVFRNADFKERVSEGFSGRLLDNKTDYLQLLAFEVNASYSDYDPSKVESLLVDSFGGQVQPYLDSLHEEEVVLSDSTNVSYFRNLFSVCKSVFGSKHPMFASFSNSFLSLDSIKSLGLNHVMFAYTDLQVLDQDGRVVSRISKNSKVSTVNEFKFFNVSGRKILMQKLETDSSKPAYVPVIGLVDSGFDIQSPSAEEFVKIDSEIDLASLLHLQYGQNLNRRLLSMESLSLHRSLLSQAGETLLASTDMNLRSATGEVLSELDSGSAMRFTGGSQGFVVAGIPLEFVEVEYESDGSFVRGFVCALGLSATKSLDLLPFFDTRFSPKLDEYPSEKEVDDLQLVGLDFELPIGLRKRGLVLGYSPKFNEYFVFSKLHTLNIAGETMRYLRYRKDYLDQNYKKEFNSFAIRHGDVIGMNGFQFEFESLDDMSVRSSFDFGFIKTTNDLISELDELSLQTMFVSLIGNDYLRFLDSNDSVCNKIELLESIRDYRLTKINRVGEYLEFEAVYSGSNDDLSGKKLELEALIV